MIRFAAIDIISILGRGATFPGYWDKAQGELIHIMLSFDDGLDVVKLRLSHVNVWIEFVFKNTTAFLEVLCEPVAARAFHA